MIARALLVSILLSGLLVAEEVAEQEAVESSAGASEEVKTTADESETSSDRGEYGVPLGPLTLTGNVYQRYRYRRTGAGTDQDVYGYFNRVSGVFPELTRLKDQGAAPRNNCELDT